MWKTLYDMFMEHPDEQQLYHSIAMVGTLLLQIGEVGKKFSGKKNGGEAAQTPSQPAEEQGPNLLHDTVIENPDQGTNTTENQPIHDGKDSSPAKAAMIKDESNLKNSEMERTKSVGQMADPDWEITFEQFLASMLTEPELVNYFETKLDLCNTIEKFRKRRLYESTLSMSQSPTASSL